MAYSPSSKAGRRTIQLGLKSLTLAGIVLAVLFIAGNRKDRAIERSPQDPIAAEVR